jgi:hypothetical protein
MAFSAMAPDTASQQRRIVPARHAVRSAVSPYVATLTLILTAD